MVTNFFFSNINRQTDKGVRQTVLNRFQEQGTVKVLNSYIDFCQPLHTQISVSKKTSGDYNAQSLRRKSHHPPHVVKRIKDIKQRFPERSPRAGTRNIKETQEHQHQQVQQGTYANLSVEYSKFTPTIVSTPRKDSDNIGSTKPSKIVTFQIQENQSN